MGGAGGCGGPAESVGGCGCPAGGAGGCGGPAGGWPPGAANCPRCSCVQK